VDTIPLDTDDEDELWFLRDIEGTLLPAQTSKADRLALGIAVLLNVGLGTLEDNGALLLFGLIFLLAT
jgi:hypothetical protein